MPASQRLFRGFLASIFGRAGDRKSLPVRRAVRVFATDWTLIQESLHASGICFPGNVLRLDLVRQDLTGLTLNGHPVSGRESAAIVNGFLAFKEVEPGRFYICGSLPALESELSELQSALRKTRAIQITAISGKLAGESPRLIWVDVEVVGDGLAIATALDTVLQTIQSPQLQVHASLDTHFTVDAAKLLPPQFIRLFRQGTTVQLAEILVFYLPRPDERRILLRDSIPASTGLGVGQSFYIQPPSYEHGDSTAFHVDFTLREHEVQPVEDVLRAGGFAITSQSVRYLGDHLHLVYVHTAADGDGFALGSTLHQALHLIQGESSSREHGRKSNENLVNLAR